MYELLLLLNSKYIRSLKSWLLTMSKVIIKKMINLYFSFINLNFNLHTFVL